MNNKKLFIILSIVAIFLLAGFVIIKLTTKKATAPSEPVDVTFSQVVENQQESDDDKQNKTNDIQGSVELTKEEVAKHSTSSDCWTIINNKVYNITEYIPQHPGGSEILRACGVDGTNLFAKRMTNDGQSVGTGTPHSSSAASQLQEFYVGDLKN